MFVKDIELYKDEMTDSYFELTETIENFIKNPTVSNKKDVQRKVKEFNHIKNRLIHLINDFWCKGE